MTTPPARRSVGAHMANGLLLGSCAAFCLGAVAVLGVLALLLLALAGGQDMEDAETMDDLIHDLKHLDPEAIALGAVRISAVVAVVLGSCYLLGLLGDRLGLFKENTEEEPKEESK